MKSHRLTELPVTPVRTSSAVGRVMLTSWLPRLGEKQLYQFRRDERARALPGAAPDRAVEPPLTKPGPSPGFPILRLVDGWRWWRSRVLTTTRNPVPALTEPLQVRLSRNEIGKHSVNP